MSDWFMDFWKPGESDHSPVQKDFLSILRSSKSGQTQVRKLVRGVEDYGPHGYKMPNNKNLGSGLYELRDTVNHFRYYYCETDLCVLVAGKCRIILLMLAAESDKDKQQSHINKARTRMSRILEPNVLNDDKHKFCKCEGE